MLMLHVKTGQPLIIFGWPAAVQILVIYQGTQKLSSIPVKINDAGLALIMKYEGCKLKSYRCPAGVLTIGFGHTGDDVTENTVWSEAQADRALIDDLDKFCKAVSSMVKVNLTDNQFSALVCLCYNIGISALKNSTLMMMVNAGDFFGAAAQFDLWNKAGGRVLEGLCKRREAERLLFECGS